MSRRRIIELRRLQTHIVKFLVYKQLLSDLRFRFLILSQVSCFVIFDQTTKMSDNPISSDSNISQHFLSGASASRAKASVQSSSPTPSTTIYVNEQSTPLTTYVTEESTPSSSSSSSSSSDSSSSLPRSRKRALNKGNSSEFIDDEAIEDNEAEDEEAKEDEDLIYEDIVADDPEFDNSDIIPDNSSKDVAEENEIYTEDAIEQMRSISLGEQNNKVFVTILTYLIS
jgi:hypothetical protein